MEEGKLRQREPHGQRHGSMKDCDVFGGEGALLAGLSVGQVQG